MVEVPVQAVLLQEAGALVGALPGVGVEAAVVVPLLVEPRAARCPQRVGLLAAVPVLVDQEGRLGALPVAGSRSLL